MNKALTQSFDLHISTQNFFLKFTLQRDRERPLLNLYLSVEFKEKLFSNDT